MGVKILISHGCHRMQNNFGLLSKGICLSVHEMQERQIRSSARSSGEENGNPLQNCCCLAWGIANSKSSRNIMSCYGPIFLLIKSHGQRSLAGCSLRGHKESDCTEGLSERAYMRARAHTHTHTHTHTRTGGRLTILNNFLLYQSLNLKIFSSSITKEEIAIIWSKC